MSLLKISRLVPNVHAGAATGASACASACSRAGTSLNVAMTSLKHTRLVFDGATVWHDSFIAVAVGSSFTSPSSSDSLSESIANTLVGALKACLVTGADTGRLVAPASLFFICGQYFKLCPLLKQNRHSWANSVGQVTREVGILVSRTLWDVYSASDLPAS